MLPGGESKQAIRAGTILVYVRGGEVTCQFPFEVPRRVIAVCLFEEARGVPEGGGNWAARHNDSVNNGDFGEFGGQADAHGCNEQDCQRGEQTTPRTRGREEAETKENVTRIRLLTSAVTSARNIRLLTSAATSFKIASNHLIRAAVA